MDAPGGDKALTFFSGLAGVLTQCGPHGVAHDSGQVLAQALDAFLDPIEATIVPVETALDPFEALFCPSLKREQVLVNAANLCIRNPNEPSITLTRRLRSRISASTFMAMVIF